jgi:uncharacterized protein YnzC (UPF0291/DUF896 family)
MVTLVNDISAEETTRRYKIRNEFITKLKGISVQDALEQLELIKKQILFDASVVTPSNILEPAELK